MKKGAWLYFGAYLVANALLTLAAAFMVSLVLDWGADGSQDLDFTVISMRLAGVVAPWLLAPIAGWLAWRPGPFYFAAAISSGLFTGNIGGGLVLGGVASGLYLVGRKVREMIGFYFPKGGVPADVELEE